MAIDLVKFDAANNLFWRRIFNIGSSANHTVHRMRLTPTGPVISGHYTGDHNFGTGLLGYLSPATDGFAVKLTPGDGTTFSNTPATFGCASFKGFGLRDLLLVSLANSGAIEGARFFGMAYDDRTRELTPFSLGSTGALYLGLNMASGKIRNFDVANVTSKPGIVF